MKAEAEQVHAGSDGRLNQGRDSGRKSRVRRRVPINRVECMGYRRLSVLALNSRRLQKDARAQAACNRDGSISRFLVWAS